MFNLLRAALCLSLRLIVVVQLLGRAGFRHMPPTRSELQAWYSTISDRCLSSEKQERNQSLLAAGSYLEDWQTWVPILILAVNSQSRLSIMAVNSQLLLYILNLPVKSDYS